VLLERKTRQINKFGIVKFAMKSVLHFFFAEEKCSFAGKTLSAKKDSLRQHQKIGAMA
jgi:hypothetical protein